MAKRFCPLSSRCGGCDYINERYEDELLEKLWNDRFYLDENVLMVNMTRLKRKLKDIGITHLLENIRGKGWRL